jgi:DNA mismatch endonuclease (patch repair protein)
VTPTQRVSGCCKSASPSGREQVERKLREKLPGGEFVGVPETRSRLMSAIRGKHTKSTEVALRMALVRSGVRGWVLHASHLPGKPDVLFWRQRVAVFVDGCFWHACPQCGHVPKTRSVFWEAKLARNRERDRRVTAALRVTGYSVVRLWEHAFASAGGTRVAIGAIQRACRSRRGRTREIRSPNE